MAIAKTLSTVSKGSVAINDYPENNSYRKALSMSAHKKTTKK
jgi:hypothetical protein